MKKLNTILLFVCLISLVHNSFLIRISIVLTGNPNTISFGLVFILALFLIIFSNYFITNNLSKNKFRVTITCFTFLIGFLLTNYFLKDTYTLKDAVLLRFPFLFIFLVIFPLNKIIIDKKLFINLSKYYLIINVFLGISQSLLNRTIISTEFNQEPFVNTIFYKDGFSTKYSYILNYGGKVRAFGLFDSGLTLGLFTIFLFICYIYMFKEKFKFSKLLILCSSILTIYLTYTRNILVMFGIVLILLFIFSYIKKKHVSLLFLVTLMCSNFLALFSDKFLDENSYFIEKFKISTLISRGNLMEDAFMQLNSLYDVLFGVGIQNIQTIDNDFIYIIYYGGLLTYLAILMFYLYTIKIANSEEGALDKSVMVFLLTYPFVSLINYVSNVYLVVCVFYIIIKLSQNVLKNGDSHEKNISL